MIITSMLSGLIALAIFLIAIQILTRLTTASPVMVYFLTALFIHLGAMAGSAWIYPALSYWHAAAIYWFGFMAYLFAFGAFYKSISLLILQQIYSVQGHRMSLERVASDIVLPCFTNRIDVMQEGGLIRQENDLYVLTEKGKSTAEKIAKLHKLFGIDQCGLYDH
jgi:predicted transcriptional regulator